MPDDCDRAQEINEEFQREAIAAHFHRGFKNAGQTAYSLTHCEDCGDMIPQKRREAIPNCTRCIDCQTVVEIHLYGRS